MTVKTVIRNTEELRPGSGNSTEYYLTHLNALESDIYNNIVSQYKNAPKNPDPLTEKSTLLVPDMYARLYVHYLCAQTDIANGDITRYSNNMILFNALLGEYSDWYTRNNMPRQKGKLRWC